jgi:RecA/RadA recombinase
MTKGRKKKSETDKPAAPVTPAAAELVEIGIEAATDVVPAAEPVRRTPARSKASSTKAPLPAPRRWTQSSNLDFYAALAADTGSPIGRRALPDATPIPTPIRWFNIATDWGGLPGAKLTVLQGPSHEGKTALLLALLRAIIDLGGLAKYIDTEEGTFDARFVEAMIGRPLDETPNLWFAPQKARSVFSEMIRDIDKFMAVSARLAAQNPMFPGAILGIDSLDNALPDAIVHDALRALEDAADEEDDEQDEADAKAAGTKTRKKKANDVDSALAGNIDMRKAALIRPILGRMVAQAGRSKVHIVLVTHETEIVHKFGKFEKREYKPRGGKAVQLYGSLRVRVTKKERTLGEDAASEHVFQILKKRSGAVEPKGTGGRFFISTGRGSSPLGIDFAREAVMLGSEIGVVVVENHHYYFEGVHLGNGYERAIDSLNASPELMTAIYGRIDQWELSTRGQPRRVADVPKEVDDV